MRRSRRSVRLLRDRTLGRDPRSWCLGPGALADGRHHAAQRRDRERSRRLRDGTAHASRRAARRDRRADGVCRRCGGRRTTCAASSVSVSCVRKEAQACGSFSHRKTSRKARRARRSEVAPKSQSLRAAVRSLDAARGSRPVVLSRRRGLRSARAKDGSERQAGASTGLTSHEKASPPGLGNQKPKTRNGKPRRSRRARYPRAADAARSPRRRCGASCGRSRAAACCPGWRSRGSAG